MQPLYIFSGSDSCWATTIDIDGANLPPEQGPWERKSTIQADDPRLERGMGKGTLKDIREKGYSIRQIVVTFEPTTTIPEKR